MYRRAAARQSGRAAVPHPSAANGFGVSASGIADIQVSARTPNATTAAATIAMRPSLSVSRANTIAPITARHSVTVIQKRAGTRSELKPGRYISNAYGPRYMIGFPISVGAGPRLSSHMTNPATA